MPELAASSVHTVTAREAADILFDHRNARFIAPFLGRERLLGDVARELEVPLSTLYRRVSRYCDAGIMQVTRVLRRKGRSLKVYRTVADAFFVSNRLRAGFEDGWPSSFDEALKRGVEHVYGDDLAEWGELIFRNEAGIFATSLARGPEERVTALADDAPAILTAAHDAVYLDFAEAKTLQRELHALLTTYAQKRGAQRYLVRLNLVPLPGDVELVI